MTNCPLRSRKTLHKSVPSAAPAPVQSLTLSQVSYYATGWLVDCEIRQHSPATCAIRRMILDKLRWHLEKSGAERCGTPELRAFFAYLIGGHLQDGGRWGNPQMNRPVRPRTVDTYHGHLRTFFQWVLAQGGLSVSPMTLISGPVCRADQIQPFTEAQIESLLAAARQAKNPRRDEAILILLLDTGIRASELCGLKHRDMDMTEKRITVLGKGGKKRTIYFGQRATKALWTYLRDKPIEDDAPLFPSERSTARGEHLSRFGLRDMIERIAGRTQDTNVPVSGVRCSAHTLRHTFAVSFLRGGGQVYALKEIMGHTDLKMTLKYVALAEADLASQRRFSPADQLGGGPAGGPRTYTRISSTKGNAKSSKPEPAEASGAKANKSKEINSKEGSAPQTQKITRAKLTEDQVRQIKTALRVEDGRTETEKRMEIALQFGLALSTVKEIALGYTWRHVEV